MPATSFVTNFTLFSKPSLRLSYFGRPLLQVRQLHSDGRPRLSNFWTPTGGFPKAQKSNKSKSPATDPPKEDSNDLLLKTGFIRQAHSGIYQFLPLGLRVQEKLERLIDKHMSKIGASKLALSSLSSEDLWKSSGRLVDSNPEIFRVKDTKFLLSPTHEEEITSLVSGIVTSHKQLPLRLYQISRKFRNEQRPREGLLRTKEFLMKDLYTFDSSSEYALQTYEEVRQAYSAFFDELKIPYLVAEADSGEIGGDLSHEYHVSTPRGEDTVISCDTCSYVVNEERAEKRTVPWTYSNGPGDPSTITQLYYAGTIHRRFVSKDRKTLYSVIFPRMLQVPLKEAERPNFQWSTSMSINFAHFKSPRLNPRALEKHFPDIDLSEDVEVKAFNASGGKIGAPLAALRRITVYDGHLPPEIMVEHDKAVERDDKKYPVDISKLTDESGNYLDLLSVFEGDGCPRCSSGTLKSQKSVEMGHTFHLGTRYSEPLGATISNVQPTTSSLSSSSSITNQNPEAATSSLPTPINAEPQTIETETQVEGLNNPPNPASSPVRVTHQTPLQMGCHGIGLSRMIAAVADNLVDHVGLNWPRVIAPFEVVVIPAGSNLKKDAEEVLDLLLARKATSPNPLSTAISNTAGEANSIHGSPLTPPEIFDAILDDRDKPIVWKLTDADLIGYPVIVVIGREWKAGNKAVELQCRRLNGAENLAVPIEQLREVVAGLLARL
ncbi:hypothetical protein MMC09_003486 [Bachmanniomyces sp. S44760]|nr:hypothetical protein [Bachmanniomyces sp. S44760]